MRAQVCARWPAGAESTTTCVYYSRQRARPSVGELFYPHCRRRGPRRRRRRRGRDGGRPRHGPKHSTMLAVILAKSGCNILKEGTGHAQCNRLKDADGSAAGRIA